MVPHKTGVVSTSLPPSPTLSLLGPRPACHTLLFLLCWRRIWREETLDPALKALASEALASEALAPETLASEALASEALAS